MATRAVKRRAPFRNEEEEREYWDKTDVETLPRKGRRPGWQASTLYIGDADDRALQAYCRATGENMAPVIRRAIRDYLIREAKKLGTTYQALAGQT